jgi:signal transduction histidine kinase
LNENERLRRRTGIGTRLALVVAALVFTSMVLAYNAERFVAERYSAKYVIGNDGADGVDPGTDGADPSSEEPVRDELGREYVSNEEWKALMGRIDRYLGIALVLLGTLIALLVGWVVSRFVTQRVRELALAVQSPVAEGQELPGPFTVGRMDEIGVLAAALNVMRDRIQVLVALLAQRDRERRSWIALVSHDLRNPLQALTACIDRSVQEARRIQDDTRRATMQHLLGTARLDVDRFEVLTLDLLDLARLEADDSMILEPVPPGELARNAAAGMRVLAEVQGRTLQVKVAPRCPELLADGRRMLRALENLLRNAIQHSERRIDLRVEPTPGNGHGAVRFSVDDDGSGLPTNADGTVDVTNLGVHKSRDDSAGLGLVVARRVAEAHGGQIGAYNRPAPEPTPERPNAGGTVWFEIPVQEGLARKRRNGAVAALDVRRAIDDIDREGDFD